MLGIFLLALMMGIPVWIWFTVDSPIGWTYVDAQFEEADMLNSHEQAIAANPDKARKEIEVPGPEKSQAIFREHLVVVKRVCGREFISTPNAKVEVCVVENQSEFGQAKLKTVWTGTTDGYGSVICQLPITGGFVLKGSATIGEPVFGEAIGHRDFSEEYAGKLEELFPFGIEIEIWAEPALVSVEVAFSEQWNHAGAYVMVGPTELPSRIIPGESQKVKFVKAEPAQATVVEFEISPGFIPSCALFSASGVKIFEESPGRPLRSKEKWSHRFALTSPTASRKFFFKVQPSVEPEGIFGDRFRLTMTDLDLGRFIFEKSYSYELGEIFYAELPLVKRASVEIVGGVLGRSSMMLSATIGRTQQEPHLFVLPVPSQVLFDLGQFPGLSYKENGVIISCSLGTDEVVRIEQITEGQEVWQRIVYPFSQDIIGLRIGDRLFECEISEGRVYKLPDTAFEEVPVPGVVEVELYSINRQLPGQKNIIRALYRGISWGSWSVRAENAKGFSLKVRLPVGEVILQHSKGLLNGYMRKKVYVTGNGSRISLN
jgi:hypothetical protein